MTEQRDDVSRRQAMGTAAGIMGGVAVSLTGDAQAQSMTGTANAAPAMGLQDPTTKFPGPPFKRQQQPWPGLASRMDPRPDHGEETYRGSGRLTGRRALITGGDSGMGRAAAIAFAREGADVAINYLPAEEEDAREVIELITAAGRKGVALPGDIRSEEFCRQLVENAVSQLGGLDILVLNAARQQTRPSIMDVSNEDFDATMKTNVYAPFWTIKAALGHLKPGSAIIGTSSIQAREPAPELYDYAQTKATITNWTISLAKQLGPKGIRVNAVAPGPVWDASAGIRRRYHGEAGKVRIIHDAGAAGSAGGTRLDLRPACSCRRQLRKWADLRSDSEHEDIELIYQISLCN